MVAVPYDYEVAGVIRVVDGDTYDLVLRHEPVDLGFRVTARGTLGQRVRLLGADTAERGQPGYAEAANYVTGWFQSKQHSNQVVRCRTEKSDSFGRYLGEIYVAGTGERLADALIGAGLATPA